jgi:hypothetical protein
MKTRISALVAVACLLATTQAEAAMVSCDQNSCSSSTNLVINQNYANLFTMQNHASHHAYANASAHARFKRVVAMPPAPPVPLPAALWLMISGIGGLLVVSRRRA